MNILLVDPHYRSKNKIYRYSLGLGYVGQICRLFGDVEIIDFTLEIKPRTLEDFLIQEEAFIESIRNLAENYDVIGITTTMGAYSRAMRICKVAKRSDNFIFIGGSHPTIIQQLSKWRNSMFKDSKFTIDAIFWAEAESTLPTVLESIKKQRGIPCIPGISVFCNGTIWHAPKAPDPFPIEKLELPAWELFSFTDPKVAFFSFSRGCPYSCSFCDERFIFPNYRPRLVRQIVNEIESNAINNNITRYRIADSTLGVHPYIFQICDGLRSLDMDLRWVAYCRVNEAVRKRGLMEAFAQAGCKCIYFGFESGSDKILKNSKPGISKKQAFEAVGLAKVAGLAVKGSFILGLPGETKGTISETIEFAESLKLDVINWHILSPCHEDLKAIKRDSIINWMKVNTDMPDAFIPDMSLRLGPDARYLWLERHIGFRATDIPSDLTNHKCGMSYKELYNFLQQAIARTVQNTEKEASYLM